MHDNIDGADSVERPFRSWEGRERERLVAQARALTPESYERIVEEVQERLLESAPLPIEALAYRLSDRVELRPALLRHVLATVDLGFQVDTASGDGQIGLRPGVAARLTFDLQLSRGLIDLQTKCLITTVQSRRSAAKFRLRTDFVGDEDRATIWMSAGVRSPVLWQRLHSSAETLDDGWTLPLVPASPSIALPTVAVWRMVTTGECRERVHGILAELPGLSYEDVSLSIQRLTDQGQIRRAHLHAEVRRLHSRVPRRGGRCLPIGGYCDRCGQPLSDPYSLSVGIGPECRKYYLPEVIDRVAHGDVKTERVATFRPDEWLSVVRAAWPRDGDW